jgi:quinolinate synthase
MLAFAAEHKRRVQASGDLARDTALFSQVGPA